MPVSLNGTIVILYYFLDKSSLCTKKLRINYDYLKKCNTYCLVVLRRPRSSPTHAQAAQFAPIYKVFMLTAGRRVLPGVVEQGVEHVLPL